MLRTNFSALHSNMRTFKQLVAKHEQHIAELMPWDLEEKLNQDNPPILLDVREPAEFSAMHIKGSINVPRGILEIVCDNDNKENAPELINARNQEVTVICGSGKRSVMAASTIKNELHEIHFTENRFERLE